MSIPTNSRLRLLTVSDIAEIIQSSTKTVRRHIATGELPAIRIGRLVRIHPDVFEQYLQVRLGTRHVVSRKALKCLLACIVVIMY